MSHLVWHKPGATLVELFSHKMNGQWFFEGLTARRYGKVFIGAPADQRNETYLARRASLDAATADRVVRCVREAASHGPKPSCDRRSPHP